MKTKTALIYLAVVAALGVYFYYFEVVRHTNRLEQQETALRLFRIAQEDITSLQLDTGDSTPVSMRTTGQWYIVEPIHSPVDEFAVEGLLASLTSLKMEREVKKSTEDLHPYGLEKPQLHLSFAANNSRHHLRIGAKAPVGNHYYASADQQNRVVLITASQQQSLNKSLFDLRRKEFFDVDKGEVNTVAIERADDELIIKKGDNQRWQSEAKPEVKIKTSKVDTLLNRLLWLRATRFLDKEVDTISQLGLAPAKIRVSLSTKQHTQSLLLGDSTKDHSVYAKGDGLAGIALVKDELLEQLPVGLTDLEDRTLVLLDVDQVQGIALQLDGHTYELARHEEKWNWVDEPNRDVPDNWRINSLLWKLRELEYLPGYSPDGGTVPEDLLLKVQLLSEDGKLATFLLKGAEGKKAARETLWFAKGSESPQPYWLSSASLREVYDRAKKLLTPEFSKTGG
jgi:hypothetical protein